MRLKVSNFAKIKKADIRMDGITVIVGDNNTGKTTVGKVLFSVFNSVYDIASKVEDNRKRELILRCRGIIRNALMQRNGLSTWETNIRPTRNVDFAYRELINIISKSNLSLLTAGELEEVFQEITRKFELQLDAETTDEFVSGILNQIEFINQIDDYVMARELIEREFYQVFSGQFCNLGNVEPAKVELTLQGKELGFEFVEKSCRSWRTNIDILHEAFFIDDPFILDKLNDRYSDVRRTSNYIIDKILATNVEENVVNAILAKEKLKEVFDILNKVISGDIEDNNGEWGISSERFSEPLRFENVSAGVKSFSLLELLLKKGILKEKDVLILDEPEIHLHPEWQIKYAQIIVLLQKKFDLSIVVTTHSRDFFEAIELFSKKYDVVDKCSFYLSRQDAGEVEFEDVSTDSTQIYKHLVNPSRLLDKIKFELEEGENE